MTLAYLLRECPDAVEADLSYYHKVTLSDMYREDRELTVRQVSVYVKYLPRGAATWQFTGGRDAVSEEVEQMMVLGHLTEGLLWQNGGGTGAKPKPPQFPAGYKATEAKAEKVVSQAEAFKAKFLNK